MNVGKKRFTSKTYLKVLIVVGLLAVIGGGAGTFASFNAETTNNGNYFATGTLVLNDNGGTNTCTSVNGLSNQNNSASNGCDTFFTLKKFTFASTTLNQVSLGSGDGSNATITVSAIQGAAIYVGDTLTISQGANTETLPVKSYAAVGATSVTVDAHSLTNSYTTGATIADNNDTYLANLTLTNAGTLDASDIKFKASSPPCTSQYTEGQTTLNMPGSPMTLGASSGSTLMFASIAAGAFKAGDTVVVSEAGHSNTFIAASPSGATSVVVTAAQNWNYAYDTSAVVSGPEFNGATAQTLCGDLTFSIVETTAAFNPDLTGAAGCAYGSTTAPVATDACDFGASSALSSVPSSLTALRLASGQGGNSGTNLSAGDSRYFLLTVHYTGPIFDNTYQNTEATAFNLTWHIDQA